MPGATDPASVAPLTAADLQSRFAAPSSPTVGIEEETMLLDEASRDLLPLAPEVVVAAGTPHVTGELPAAQVELLTSPAGSVPAAAAELRAVRRLAVEACARVTPDARLAAAGVHPFTAARGQVRTDGRYRRIAEEYGSVARRQLVFGLHIHVAVRGAEIPIAVHDAIRSYLPELAALAAHAPFHEGEDTGLASVRPTICRLLPRQGVPPAHGSWDGYAAALAFGHASGFYAEPAGWWWEVRLHPGHGTLELRVPDAQATVADVAAVAAVVHALVVSLARRVEDGETLPVHPVQRIEENRWSACRHGVEGRMADLATGSPEPTRDRLHRLLDDLVPTAIDLGCADELEAARGLVEAPRAARAREIADAAGLVGVVDDLVTRFLAG